MPGNRWQPRTTGEKRARRRARERERRGARGYDGVSDEEVFRRDKWTCRMPACACPEGRTIDRALAGTGDQWAPSVDHVIPLSDGGPDNAGNKRTAHARCNWDANAAAQAEQAQASLNIRQPQPLAWTISDALAGREPRRGGRVFATPEDLRQAWGAEAE